MSDGINTLAGFDQLLKENPTWLDEAVPTDEASRIIGIPACTLTTWRSRGGGPPFLKLGGRTVRYQRRELFTWMAERRRTNTSDRGNSHGRADQALR